MEIWDAGVQGGGVRELRIEDGREGWNGCG
jgi:hypothetical protein